MEVENAVREIAHEELLSPSMSVIGSPMSPTFPTSFETLTKKVRTRGRKRRSVLGPGGANNNGNGSTNGSSPTTPNGNSYKPSDKGSNGKEN